MRVLRAINSAAFGFDQAITSVNRALVLLGVQQVKKWASVWAMAGLNSGGTPEAVSVALLRARSCEVIGNRWADADAGAELFLLGMCSMLDAIVNQPIEEAIAGLQLSTRVRDALMGGRNEYRSILDAVVAHEQGDWDASGAMLEALGLPASAMPAAYADALRWAREVSASAAAA
jgi:EAL and modified HD-GYP domain-containing signal transduction protein